MRPLVLVAVLLTLSCYKHVESASEVHSAVKDDEQWQAAGQEVVSANEETSTSVIQKPTEIDVHKVVNEFETPAATAANPNPKRQLKRQTVIDVAKKLGEVDKNSKSAANTQAAASQESGGKKHTDAQIDGKEKTVTTSRTGPPGWVYFAIAALIIVVAIVAGIILSKTPQLKAVIEFLKRL